MFSKALFITSTLITVAVAQLPAPTCYQGTSTSARPSTDCSQFVDDFCDSAALVSARVHDSIGHCYNLPENRVCDFIAWNTLASGAGAPTAANCKAVLNNVISQCILGGWGQFAPNLYTFNVDVNMGQCTQGVHGGS